jgi:hypothetical protein
VVKARSAADRYEARSNVAALEAMRTYKDPKRDKDGLYGLVAALGFIVALDLEFPDWVKNRLVAMAALTICRGGARRQNKLRRKMGIFENDLVRYCCVVMCDSEKNPTRYVEMKTFIKILNRQKLNRRESAQFTKSPAKRNHGRRSTIFEDAFEQIQHRYFAPEDSSGMRQSYYRVQRMFKSKRLANFVAVRVVTALIEQVGFESNKS